jgi:hypothetical protein
MAPIILLAGVITILPTIAWTDKSRDPKTGFVLLICALALTVVVHELGHLVAGWLVGFRLSLVQVGPFVLSAETGVLRLTFGRKWPALGLAGMSFQSLRNLHERLLFFSAGGVIANTLGIAAVLLSVDHVFRGLGGTRTGTLAAQFIVFSFVVAVGSLIPLASTLPSDGMWIKTLLSQDARARQWISICAIVALYSKGVRPREWKHTWLQRAISTDDVPHATFVGHWLGYMYAADRDDRARADAHLERCLSVAGTLPIQGRDLVAQEAAFAAAWLRGDAALADRWLTQVSKRSRLPSLIRKRLDVAMCYAGKDYGTAESSWQEGLSLIDATMAGRARDRSREAWLEWRTEIQDRSTQPPSANQRCQ